MSLYAVNRNAGVALYRQIMRRLEEDVIPVYGPGECLPAEAELAMRFGVNRHTLRRAIDGLVEAGRVERRHGVGVFVLQGPVDYPIGTGTRFTANLAALGLASSNHILHKQVVPANDGVASHLEIARGEPVIWIESLRLVDGHPMCVISHFLPAASFQGLETFYQGGSLHRLLEDRFGCRIRRAESLLTAVLPQGDDARLLAMPLNRPVLRVKSVNRDERSGRVIEYAVTRFRADRTQLRINP